MAKHTYGLASVSIGTIGTDGTVAPSFVAVGETVQGTATMTSDDNTVTDFKIEESDSPVESVITEVGKITLAWSTYNIDQITMVKFLGGTGTTGLLANRIATLGSVTAGTGYTNGTYSNVTLNGGSGTGAKGNITVAGGIVTAVVILNGGGGYTPADVLTALASAVGGTGTGFSVPVATVTALAGSDTWTAPDSFPDVEKSIQVTDKKGNVVTFPRAKIATKLSLSFARDKLGQLDFSATILQPTDAGTRRMLITYSNS